MRMHPLIHHTKSLTIMNDMGHQSAHLSQGSMIIHRCPQYTTHLLVQVAAETKLRFVEHTLDEGDLFPLLLSER
jgi:hypothetical protein